MNRIDAHNLIAYAARLLDRREQMLAESEVRYTPIDLISAGRVVDQLYDMGYELVSRLIGEDDKKE